MRAISVAVALAVLGGSVLPAVSAYAQPADMTIGVAFDGPSPLNDAIFDAVQREIGLLVSGRFQVQFPAEYRAMGDWSVGSVAAGIDRLLADPDVDLVLTLGVLSSLEASRRTNLAKPLVAPFVLGFDDSLVPSPGGGSGVTNLSYLVMPKTFERDLRAFRDVVEYERLAVLFSANVVEGIEGIREGLEAVLQAEGISFQGVLVRDSAAPVLAEISGDVDAVFVLPQVQLPDDEMVLLAQGLVARGLPSFSLLGRRDVERGIMASLNPEVFPRISRRIALNVQNILLGDRPEDLRVAFAAGERLTLNLDTANAIGLPVPWRVLTEADVIESQDETVARQIDLLGAVSEAMASNRDLVAQRLAVESGAAGVDGTRGLLLPQVDLGATHVTIDEDRAEASFGSASQRTLEATAGISQVLYSDDAWTGFRVSQLRQRALELQLERTRLDIGQDAATAYLQVLRSMSLERIQRENLQQTRSNLELARVRASIGQSGPADVLRFESQLAINVSDAIEANALRNVAEIELNRLLHRPLEEDFQTAEKNLADVLALLENQGLNQYFGSKRSFSILREFMVIEAARRSPELSAIDANIAAQERVSANTARAMWLPDLVAQGEVSRTLDESGAGSDAPSGADDTDWSIALGLSFPLFQGGAKFADRRESSAELARLRIDRQSVGERVEQRMRNALHLAGSSHAAIEQARRANEAARQSLAIVVDSYSQGTNSILDLLDAQTNSLVAEQQESAAVFDFFIDLMEVQRAAGGTLLFLDQAKRESFLDRCDAFFAEQGMPIHRR